MMELLHTQEWKAPKVWCAASEPGKLPTTQPLERKLITSAQDCCQVAFANPVGMEVIHNQFFDFDSNIHGGAQNARFHQSYSFAHQQSPNQCLKQIYIHGQAVSEIDTTTPLQPSADTDCSEFSFQPLWLAHRSSWGCIDAKGFRWVPEN